jgi:hypothetical protein
MRLRVHLLCLLSLALIVSCLMATACGGGGKNAAFPDEAALPTPLTPSGSPESTPQAVPTFDAGTELVEFRSPDKGYVLSYPKGWQVIAGPDTGIDTFVRSLPSGVVLAQLSVTCRQGMEGQGVLDLMRVTQGALKGFAQINLATATPIEIGGTAGKKLIFSATIGDIKEEQAVAYAVLGDCGWRVGLAAYDEGQLQQYLPLFDRIIASFGTTASAVPPG